MATSVREAVLGKLARARAILNDLERQGTVDVTAIEWQKGYAKAWEDALDLEGITLREAVLGKLARARAILNDLERQETVDVTAIEWQKGYAKAWEDALDLEGITLRRYPRRPTAIPAEIARILPEPGARGQRGKGKIVDLCVGGCGLTTGMELSVSERVELAFRFPEGDTPVTVGGLVRHAQKLYGEFLAGVEFQSPPGFHGAF